MIQRRTIIHQVPAIINTVNRFTNDWNIVFNSPGRVTIPQIVNKDRDDLVIHIKFTKTIAGVILIF